MTKLIKVFVYGTLKRGQPNHYLMTDKSNGYSKFITIGETIVSFPLVVATRYNIPFLLNRPGMGNQISGEIFEVDEKMFAVLDKLEDYPSWYDREIQEINANGEKIPCWIYTLKIFPEKMLQLPYLRSYENTKDKQYIESYNDDLQQLFDEYFKRN
ncbi:hypothetical protein PVAND_014727 [Polypedilum vanderplanki]|uniref:Gamma-glutamylcyclotransferase family protein n=1 Tax=Polypedilum vanderplanki TaxID=319348 RepID=A0A9J6BAV8_POLVA|nr:hypothetical protein PVAND_014727 [Polypedilum vanderplanki]